MSCSKIATVSKALKPLGARRLQKSQSKSSKLKSMPLVGNVVEKDEELLRAVTLHRLAHDLARGDVEGHQQAEVVPSRL